MPNSGPAGSYRSKEVDIAETCVVVAVPGLEVEIQASKAGVLEAANIFAVNAADRPEASRLKRELRSMLDLDPAMRDGYRSVYHLRLALDRVTVVNGQLVWARPTSIERSTCFAMPRVASFYGGLPRKVG